jgi:septal ring-binding cell division protein DamX
MARETTTRLVDDLDRSEANTTIAFGWQGTAYEIDLSTKNARAFEQAVAPYVNVARRTSGQARKAQQRRSPAATLPTVIKTDLAAIREWAASNGHKVADRGRISRAIVDAFHAAQHAAADAARMAVAPATTAPSRTESTSRPVAKKAAPRKTTAPAKKAARKTAPRKTTARKAAPVKSTARKATRRRSPATAAPTKATAATEVQTSATETATTA